MSDLLASFNVCIVHYLLLTWDKDLSILKKAVANVPNGNVLWRGPGEANRLHILRIALFFAFS